MSRVLNGRERTRQTAWLHVAAAKALEPFGRHARSLIMAPVAGHSAKPERFLEMIEAYYPNLPKIELNRRGPPRDGWDAWGLEAEEPSVSAEGNF